MELRIPDLEGAIKDQGGGVLRERYYFQPGSLTIGPDLAGNLEYDAPKVARLFLKCIMKIEEIEISRSSQRPRTQR